MLGKLRIKFVILTMLIVVVIATLFSVVTAVTYRMQLDASVSNGIEGYSAVYSKLMSSNSTGGTLETGSQFDSRAFVLEIEDGVVTKIFAGGSVFSGQRAASVAVEALNTGNRTGKIDTVMYKTMSVQGTAGSVTVGVIGIDSTAEDGKFFDLLWVVLIIAGGTTVSMLVFALLLSIWITSSASDALIKQKQFVSDASHGLKTPVTVIKTSYGMLENSLKTGMVGDNERRWLSSIGTQADLISKMVTDLLTQSKLDTHNAKKSSGKNVAKIGDEYVNISKVIYSIVLSFESIAFEAGKKYSYQIYPDIVNKTSRASVRDAVVILVENAIKHSAPGAHISVRLLREGNGILFVQNNGSSLQESDTDRIFQRFFRTADARSKSTGSGLGLSILKSHAEKNDWKLSVKIKSSTVIFKLVF